MNIGDLQKKTIKPFEIEDEKLVRLFSFFLHFAPTIDSVTAANIGQARLERNWNNFICVFGRKSHAFLMPSVSRMAYASNLSKQGLDDSAEINRKKKGFVCKRRKNTEEDWECFLRHIRNAIAHNRVYMSSAGNRKYILFEDSNDSGNPSARIFISQTDLQNLKKGIMR